MNSSTQVNKPKKLLYSTLAAIFWIAAWWGIAAYIGMEVVLPTPIHVFTRLCELIVSSEFYTTAAISLFHVLCGFLCGVIVGTLLAFLTHFVAVARYAFSPLLTVIKSTPVASFVILALIFIGKNTLPVFISAIIVIPLVWSNVSAGLESIDKDLLEVTRLYAFDFKKKLRTLYIPSLKPYFFSALTTALGLAWKSGISAEVIANSKDSIGNMLNNSKVYLESADLFAWTIVVIFFSLIFEWLIKLIGKRGAVK